MSVPSKLYERVLEARLREYVEHTLEEEQCGFRPGRGTQDLIFTLRLMIDRAISNRKPMYLCFIDLIKAFDTVQREMIWQELGKRNVEDGLIKGIQSLYKETRNYIRTGNMRSDQFTTREGVRQGAILSPLLFTVLLDGVMKQCKERMTKYCVGYRRQQPEYLSVLAYADDLVLIAASEAELQENIIIWKEALENKNLKISLEKTKTMLIHKEALSCDIKIEEVAIEQVGGFKYLGPTLDETGKMDNEINNRGGATERMFYGINKAFLRKKEISKQTKIRVYKAMYIPTLIHSSESWVMTKKYESRLQAVEMKHLRRIEGVTRLDRIRNVEIRNRIGIKSIQSYIEESQLRWFGHMARMNQNRIAKIVWEAGSTKKRCRGRPRKTWNDQVTGVLKRKNLRWKEALKIAKDRKQWISIWRN